MRIVVQDRRTNAYLTGETNWIYQIDAARRFNTSLEALRFCAQRKLKHMDMLVCYPDGKAKLRVPLC